MPELSIIIVSHNTKELLKNCINSVIRNTQNIEYEIIVVDNASSDGSIEMLKKEFPRVSIITNRENLGFAKANNKGIKVAKGENILLLNSDTLILGNCLQKILKFAKSTSDAGVIGCKVLNADKTLQYSCYRAPNFLTELLFFTKGIIKGFWDPFTLYKYMKYWDHNSIRKVDCVSGAFLFVKRQVLEKIGMLDENFFMYYEDAEFCRRVRKKTDFKVYYYPEAEITHLKGMSIDKYNYITLKSCYSSALKYIAQCYGETVGNIFNYLCRCIWRLEIFVFSLLKRNKKFRRKLYMLKECMAKY